MKAVCAMLGVLAAIAAASLHVRPSDADDRQEPRPRGALFRLGSPGLPVGICVGFAPVPDRGHVALAAALSPDGRFIVVSRSGDLGLVAFERTTGKRVAGPLAEWSAAPDASIALARSGKLLAVASARECAVAAWPLGSVVQRMPLHAPTLDESAAFSADGKRLAFGTDRIANHAEKRVKAFVLDVTDGSMICAVDVVQDRRCSAGLAPDGKVLATWGQYWSGDDPRPPGRHVVQLWDVATGKEIRRLKIADPDSLVSAAAFSADGKTLAVASTLPAVHFFDRASGRERRRLAGQHADIRSVVFSPDGALLVARSADDTVQAWNTADYRPIELAAAPRGQVLGLAFPGHGEMLAVGIVGQTLSCWNLLGGNPRAAARGHYASVVGLAFTPDGKTLRSAAVDRTVCSWHVATGKLADTVILVEETLARQHANVGCGRNRLVLSPDAGLAATSDLRTFGRVRVWALPGGGTIADLEPLTASEHFHLAFSGDSQQLAVAGGRLITRWGHAMRRKLAEIPYELRDASEADDTAASVVQSRDGRRLALVLPRPAPEAVRRNDTVRVGREPQREARLVLKDTVAGKDILVQDACYAGRLPALPGGAAANTVFSPDGKLLAFPDMLNRVVLLRTDNGAEYGRLDLGRAAGAVTALAFAPDSRVLAVAHGGAGSASATRVVADESRLELWDIAGGTRYRQFTGHVGPITCLAFAPAGRTLASGGADTRVMLWDAGPRPSRQALPLGADNLKTAWAWLADASGKESLEAEYRLLRSPATAVPFLKARLREPIGPTVTDLRAWVADLDSEDYETRERAQADLAQLGLPAEPELRAARAQPISLEMRRRIDGLLAKLELRKTSLAEWRLLRAVEILEHIGTPEARTVLHSLATGRSPVLLSRAAHSALERLKRNSGE